MTLMSTYLRVKARHCRNLAEDAEGWVIKALNEMADELDAKAAELERRQG
jgi:hypothetical protein